MTELFQNKYRIETTRLKDWDYSSEGGYFITICTQDRECYFGNVINGQMRLSEIGKIVKQEWLKTSHIRKNVLLDEFIVMPNHLHGIIVIRNNVNNVETHCNASLRKYKNKFGPQSHNLSAIIRGFKGTITKKIHLADFKNFQWQPRFYDHIIRNQKSLDRMRKYIIDNPKKWEFDRNNPFIYANQRPSKNIFS